MKHQFSTFFFLIACTISALSCDSGVNETVPGNVQVHFQGGFIETPVEVLINGNVVYSETVSTNNIIGLAGGGSFLTQRGTNVVEIRVDDMFVWQDVLVVRKRIYLGVNYRRIPDSINVYRSNEGFVYF